MTESEVIRLAKEDAAEAILMARSTIVDPIVWITGNNYMPPLRAFGWAEAVFQADSWELWDAYVETFELELEQANVYLDCPEYDNALYVVDLNRFEYVEDAPGDTLQSEWRLRSPNVGQTS